MKDLKIQNSSFVLKVSFVSEGLILGVSKINFHIKGIKGNYTLDLYDNPGFIYAESNGRELMNNFNDKLDVLKRILPFLYGKKFARMMFIGLSARQMYSKSIEIELNRVKEIINSNFNSMTIFGKYSRNFSALNLVELSISTIREMYKIEKTQKCLVDGIELSEDSVIVAGQRIIFN